MKYLLLGLWLLLSACAPAKSTKQTNTDTLLPIVSQLPGAVVTTAEGFRFSYPEQVMFGTHAVLPMPGGPKLLNPLAEFLKQNPELVWLIDVRVQTIYGLEYDQALAEKRSELLASYLMSKGVDLQNLSFQPATEEGAQLVFTLKLSD